MLRGTDQSKWQKNAVTSGDFIILKATEGCGYVDPTCDAKYQLNKKAGKLLGVYHFARPDLNQGIEGAKQEARFFFENIKGYIGEAVLALDYECAPYSDDWAYAFAKEVYDLTKEYLKAESGVWVMLYASASKINEFNWSKTAQNCGLWIAGYPNAYNVPNPPTPSVNDMPFVIGAWKFWAIWQYSSSAGHLDLDIANMDAAAWKKYANPSSKPAPTPSPTPENPLDKYTDEQLADMVIAGKFGNGEERKQKLGSRYDRVQAIVDERLAPKAQFYTIQPGDNLTVIANKFGTSVAQLVAWNNIQNPNLIYAGAQIRVK